LSAALEHATAEDTLLWAIDTFAGRNLALLSAFGPGSAVLIHMLSELGARVPMIFIDTLHHFPETLEHVERVRALYGLDLRTYRPAPTRAEFDARYGERLWERDLDAYQRVTKVEPFERAVEGLDAWITGRRRDQASSRQQLPPVEDGPRVRINPLASWSRDQIWHYILDRSLPYNPLHDAGYASIGDAPLTTPTAAEEHERAGRWRGDARMECGIHSSEIVDKPLQQP
jgi:phosphoadenosine phosphosulfate reductase